MTKKEYERATQFGFKPGTIFMEELREAITLPPVPNATDVLYLLVMDSDAIEYTTFEQWADSIGYDTDSRKAEQIYRAGIQAGLTLRQMFGDSGLRELREVFQDY